MLSKSVHFNKFRLFLVLVSQQVTLGVLNVILGLPNLIVVLHDLVVALLLTVKTITHRANKVLD